MQHLTESWGACICERMELLSGRVRVFARGVAKRETPCGMATARCLVQRVRTEWQAGLLGSEFHTVPVLAVLRWE